MIEPARTRTFISCRCVSLSIPHKGLFFSGPLFSEKGALFREKGHHLPKKSEAAETAVWLGVPHGLGDSYGAIRRPAVGPGAPRAGPRRGSGHSARLGPLLSALKTGHGPSDRRVSRVSLSRAQGACLRVLGPTSAAASRPGSGAGPALPSPSKGSPSPGPAPSARPFDRDLRRDNLSHGRSRHVSRLVHTSPLACLIRGALGDIRVFPERRVSNARSAAITDPAPAAAGDKTPSRRRGAWLLGLGTAGGPGHQFRSHESNHWKGKSGSILASLIVQWTPSWLPLAMAAPP